MKTATVTWVSYNNYGTLLQAYALQQALERLGHENVILDDNRILKAYFAAKREDASPAKPAPAPSPESAAQRVKRLLSEPGRIGRILLARRDPERYGLPYEGSQAACGAFRQDWLKLRRDVTVEKLPDLNEDYDAFLCGSDQVWSVFDEIFNPYYYLDFAAKKKIAYAPCLGSDRIPEDKADTIRQLLSDFDGISAREDVSAKQLSELTGREVAWVCDPTLLHDRAFWEDFAKDVSVPRKRYLLCYFLENRPWYFAYARKTAKKMGLKLLLIPNRWDYLRHGFVADWPMGPREFVALFRDADYVLTDSYHGSIFSVIFEKNFRYLLRFSEEDPKSQNIRIKALFGRVGLQERIVTETMDNGLLFVNYGAISPELMEFRRESQQYLEKSLQQE